MRLLRLHLKDFLNHEATQVELGRLTVIAGPNNSGKSAIKDGIEMALTGTARTTDKGGREAESLIRAGRESFTVAATLEAQPDVPGEDARPVTIEVERTRSTKAKHYLDIRTLEMGDWEGTIANKQDALYRLLRADGGLIRACIHAGQLADMKPEKQEELLFGVLGLSFTFESLEKLLVTGDVTKEDLELLYVPGQAEPRFLGAYGPSTHKTLGPEIFDEAHKYAFEKRRQAKRDRNHADEELQAANKRVRELVQKEPTLQAIDREKATEMQAKLEQLEAERDRLTEAKGRAATLPAQIEGTIAYIAQLEEQIEAWETWEKRRDELCRGGKEFGAQLKTLEGTVEAQERQIEEAHREIQRIEAAVESFSGENPTCPLSGAPCDLTDARKKKLLEKLHERAAELARWLETHSDLDEQNELLRKYIDVKQSKPEGEGPAKLGERLEAKKAELAELESTREEADEEELAALKERISQGHAKIRLVETYLTAVQRVEEKKQDLEEKQQRVETLERLVAALGTGGAKLRAVDEPLRELQERINARLKEYAKGYELAIETKDKFELAVRTPGTNGGWIQIKGLSTSERLRVGIALQDALCHLSGLGFLLIDNFDMLDTGNREAVGEALRQWADEYETILILTTRDSRPPASDARTTYWVENGAVEVIQ